MLMVEENLSYCLRRLIPSYLPGALKILRIPTFPFESLTAPSFLFHSLNPKNP